MKITIYTITECPFSKQEREYLSSHGLTFEEKNLETNREFLTEMLAVGSNFAGTPVTKIEKDDGQIAVLKGFTAAEFAKTLGFEQASVPTSVPTAEPTQPQVVPPPIESVPLAETQQPIPPPVETVPAPPPVEVALPEVVAPTPPVADPAFASILNNLQQQAQVATPVAPVPQPVPAAPLPPVAAVAGQPTIPDPQF